jgi:hypothetical protein
LGASAFDATARPAAGVAEKTNTAPRTGPVEETRKTASESKQRIADAERATIEARNGMEL